MIAPTNGAPIMHINPDTFELHFRRSGLTQRALAELAGVSAKTISRVRKGENQNRATVVALADALGTQTETLASPPSDPASQERGARLRAAGYRRLSTHISGLCAVQFELVEARYGVTPRALIDAAPLLLTLLAEMSLSDRRAQLAAFDTAREALLEAAPQHIRGVWRADQDLENGRESEEASIAASDIRGSKIDADEWSGEDQDLFVSYLQKLAGGLDNAVVSTIDGSTDHLLYNILKADLARTTCDVSIAEFALTNGHVRLRDVPEELYADDRGPERIAWLTARVPEAARLEWEAEERWWSDLVGPDIGSTASGEDARSE